MSVSEPMAPTQFSFIMPTGGIVLWLLLWSFSLSPAFVSGSPRAKWLRRFRGVVYQSWGCLQPNMGFCCRPLTVVSGFICCQPLASKLSVSCRPRSLDLSVVFVQCLCCPLPDGGIWIQASVVAILVRTLQLALGHWNVSPPCHCVKMRDSLEVGHANPPCGPRMGPGNLWGHMSFAIFHRKIMCMIANIIMPGQNIFYGRLCILNR